MEHELFQVPADHVRRRLDVQHQLVYLPETALIPTLDEQAKAGWEVVNLWREGAMFGCLLRRPDAAVRYLDTPLPLTGTTAQALEALAEREAK